MCVSGSPVKRPGDSLMWSAPHTCTAVCRRRYEGSLEPRTAPVQTSTESARICDLKHHQITPLHHLHLSADAASQFTK